MNRFIGHPRKSRGIHSRLGVFTQPGSEAAGIRPLSRRYRGGTLASKRASLRDHVECIVFDRGRITILDSLQLDGATPRTLPFRIEGEIANGSKRRWAQDVRFGSWVPGAVLSSSI
jgi:hypothetical protein